MDSGFLRSVSRPAIKFPRHDDGNGEKTGFTWSYDVNHRLIFKIFTSLAKEVMFLVALFSLSVCLSVCLSVDNITQKGMNGLG